MPTPPPQDDTNFMVWQMQMQEEDRKAQAALVSRPRWETVWVPGVYLAVISPHALFTHRPITAHVGK